MAPAPEAALAPAPSGSAPPPLGLEGVTVDTGLIAFSVQDQCKLDKFHCEKACCDNNPSSCFGRTLAEKKPYDDCCFQCKRRAPHARAGRWPQGQRATAAPCPLHAMQARRRM